MAANATSLAVKSVGPRRTVPLALLLAGILGIAGTGWAATVPSTQTIVMLRHGEKPAAGLGQLDCQGLNRALALPAVLARNFARPAAIFAPDPGIAKEDGGQLYSYVRPLATIEPTAVRLGLPIDASIGFADIDALQKRLLAPELNNAVVIVAWEHTQIVALARALLASQGGDANKVPDWKGKDFDSLYVVKITRDGDQVTASFEPGREGLDNLPTTCPG